MAHRGAGGGDLSMRLALLLSAALLLRLWGTGHGYPDCVAADERPVIMDAVRFVTDGTLEPAHLNYPDLFSYLFSLGLYLAHGLGWLLDVGSAGLSVRLAHYFAPVQVALVGRLLSAAAGVGTVWLTFLVGRRAYGAASGLGGALFAAVSAALVSQARFALPDVTMALLATAAYVPMVEIPRTGRWRDYAAAGLLVGLAMSAKYNAGIALAGLAAAHVLALRREGGHWLDARPLWAAVATALGFLLGSPYWLVLPGPYWQALLNVSSNMQFSLTGATWPHLALLADLLLAEMGWGALALAGCAYAAWRRTPADWIALAVLIPAFLYIGSWPKGGVHYALFCFPLAGLLAARLVVERGGSRRGLWVGGALAVLSLPQVWTALAQGARLRQPDVRQQAARWIEGHVPDGAAVGVYRLDYTPPLKGDIHRRLLRRLARDPAVDAAAAARLRQMDRQLRIYTQLTLEYMGDEPLVPPAYRAGVDLKDPKTRETFRRRWMEYDQLVEWGVRWVILPRAGYARFLKGEAPPPGTAAHYYFHRSRAYVKQFLDGEDGRFRLVQGFGSDAGTGDHLIGIYQVR